MIPLPICTTDTASHEARTCVQSHSATGSILHSGASAAGPSLGGSHAGHSDRRKKRSAKFFNQVKPDAN